VRALRRILDERRHVVLPAWPGPCRAAARRAFDVVARASGAQEA
jgi:hypothetical protein